MDEVRRAKLRGSLSGIWGGVHVSPITIIVRAKPIDDAVGSPAASVTSVHSGGKDIGRSRGDAALCQAEWQGLFNDLVSGHKHRVRHRQAKHLCGLKVDDEFEFGRLQNG